MPESGSSNRPAPPAWPIALGLAAAILSPALELATGNPLPYLLVLTILMGVVWGVARLRPREIGLRPGGTQFHLVAVLYPILATGVLAVAAWAAGSTLLDVSSARDLPKDIGIMLVATWIGVLITEEGFFRGALWGLGARSGWSQRSVLIWTSVAFMAWHIAVPIIEQDFQLPGYQIPIYLANVVLLGLAWGLLRLISRSLLVACTAHAVWNALVYNFFGYGPESTFLGITRLGVFDPERGILGLVVNVLVVVLLLRWARRRGIDLSLAVQKRTNFS